MNLLQNKSSEILKTWPWYQELLANGRSCDCERLPGFADLAAQAYGPATAEVIVKYYLPYCFPASTQGLPPEFHGKSRYNYCEGIRIMLRALGYEELVKKLGDGDDYYFRDFLRITF